MPDQLLLRIELFGTLRVRTRGREITHFETRKAATLLAGVEPDGAVVAARVELGNDLLEDLRRLDAQMKE